MCIIGVIIFVSIQKKDGQESVGSLLRETTQHYLESLGRRFGTYSGYGGTDRSIAIGADRKTGNGFLESTIHSKRTTSHGWTNNMCELTMTNADYVRSDTR